MNRITMRTISLVLLLAFFADTACYGLATLPATQNPIAKREILAALQRTQIRYAESDDAIRLLSANDASCLLLSSGKYLVTKEVAQDDMGLLRAIIHEDIEAIMQILADENSRNKNNKYQAIKGAILKYFPPNKDNKLPINLYVNHTVARAFEWLSLLEDRVIVKDEIMPQDMTFISAIRPIIMTNKHNYFTTEFWDSRARGARIREALNKGMRFYQVNASDDNGGKDKLAHSEDVLRKLINRHPKEVASIYFNEDGTFKIGGMPIQWILASIENCLHDQTKDIDEGNVAQIIMRGKKMALLEELKYLWYNGDIQFKVEKIDKSVDAGYNLLATSLRTNQETAFGEIISHEAKDIVRGHHADDTSLAVTKLYDDVVASTKTEVTRNSIKDFVKQPIERYGLKEISFVFDIDGTLNKERNTPISDEIAAQLADILAKGANIQIITGKSKEELEEYGIFKSLFNVLQRRYAIDLIEGMAIYTSDGGGRYVFNKNCKLDIDEEYSKPFSVEEARIMEEVIRDISEELEEDYNLKKDGIVPFIRNFGNLKFNFSPYGNVDKEQYAFEKDEKIATKYSPPRKTRKKIADNLIKRLKNRGISDIDYIISGSTTIGLVRQGVDKTKACKDILRSKKFVFYIGDETRQGNDALITKLAKERDDLAIVSVDKEKPSNLHEKVIWIGKNVAGTEYFLDCVLASLPIPFKGGVSVTFSIPSVATKNPPTAVLILAGPSGAGKSTYLAKLQAKYPNLIYQPPLTTTRKPRDGEKEGERYHFVTEDKFRRLEEAGEILFSRHASGCYYGTYRSYVDNIIEASRHGKITVLETNVVPAVDKMLKVFPSARVVTVLNALPVDFTNPNKRYNLEKDLIERLDRRSSMAKEELKLRAAESINNVPALLKLADLVVVNPASQADENEYAKFENFVCRINSIQPDKSNQLRNDNGVSNNDNILDLYDAQSTTVLLTDLLYTQLHEDRTYEIKYDTSRLTTSQIGIIEEYVRLLQLRSSNPDSIKLRPFSSAQGSKEESLIAVYCTGKDFKGEGHVDVAILDGELKEYLLRVAGMVNIALASSNIPDNLSREDVDKYRPIMSYIKNQYKAILGEELAIPDSPEDILKIIKWIVLGLPKSMRMNTDQIEEFNRLAKAALTAA